MDYSILLFSRSCLLVEGLALASEMYLHVGGCGISHPLLATGVSKMADCKVKDGGSQEDSV